MTCGSPTERLALASAIADVLGGIKGALAVTISDASVRNTRGTDSSIDIAIHYSSKCPINPVDLAREIDQFAIRPPTFTRLWEWGSWRNGGASILSTNCRADIVYREVEQLDEVVADAQRGTWRHHYDEQPPFGFLSTMLVGELFYARPLVDSVQAIASRKDRLGIYPPQLRSRLVDTMTWLAEIALRSAQDYASRGDIIGVAGCTTRAVHYWTQALFALNRTWFVNHQTSMSEIPYFDDAPEKFNTEVTALLASSGATATELARSVDRLGAMQQEIVRLAGPLYCPRS